MSRALLYLTDPSPDAYWVAVKAGNVTQVRDPGAPRRRAASWLRGQEPLRVPAGRLLGGQLRAGLHDAPEAGERPNRRSGWREGGRLRAGGPPDPTRAA